MIVNVLSIAGSDPSGGAGIQADLKTFSALGAYGMAAITSLTAQNTKGVTAVYELPAGFVAAQIDAVFSDIRVDAVKIGMAGSPETIKAISEVLKKYRAKNVVLDPVMIAQSGDKLISQDAVEAIKRDLAPLADILTPNMPEAEILSGRAVTDMMASAQTLLTLGAPNILLKGGHAEGPICFDAFANARKTIALEAPRIKTKNNHGTGCTLSSAIAVYLAQGLPVEDSCAAAKKYITEALRRADELEAGGGHGPVHHFHEAWK